MQSHTLTRDLYQKSRLYWSVLKAQKSKKPVPVVTNLYVTGACQARCVYCYVEMVGENDGLTAEQKKTKRESEREFTLEEWKQAIDSLYDRGMRFVALAGGEPLIYPKIDELIEHIASKNIFFNLSSNAFLIDRHIDAARAAAEVSISIDGDMVANDKNRGAGYFEQAVRGIDTAIDNGIRVRLLTVVTQHNFDQIDWLIKFAEERNTYITFTPMLDAPEIRKEASLEVRLEDEKIREFFKKLKDVKKRSMRVINSVQSMDYMINYPIKYGGIIWRDSPEAGYYAQPCPYGRFQFLLTNRGELFPCAVMWNNEQHFQPKNVMDVGIDEALHHASYDLKCQSCSFANGPDWNSVTNLPWLLYGLKMTVNQALNHSRASGHVPGNEARVS
jgi:MoaA/NifB/PqqE/SkfB family radical SAM enzyme